MRSDEWHGVQAHALAERLQHFAPVVTECIRAIQLDPGYSIRIAQQAGRVLDRQNEKVPSAS